MLKGFITNNNMEAKGSNTTVQSISAMAIGQEVHRRLLSPHKRKRLTLTKEEQAAVNKIVANVRKATKGRKFTISY